MTRNPFVAALLTIWMPGMGQIYAGALGRGAIICGLWWVAVVVVFAIAGSLPAWAGAWAPYVLSGVAIGAIMMDAALTAEKAPRPFVPESYNRWYVYLTMPFFFGAPLWLPLRTLIKRNFYESFKIPGPSMERTILAGDYIYTTPWHGVVDRGVNVIFLHDGHNFVKRVVGIAGDTLSMRHDSLYRNGHYVSEPYAISTEPPQSAWGPIVVPSHNCFVLGDNRDNSLDSRNFGFVPIDSIYKRPIGVYLSIDPTTHEIRWSRIGRDISR